MATVILCHYQKRCTLMEI